MSYQTKLFLMFDNVLHFNLMICLFESSLENAKYQFMYIYCLLSFPFKIFWMEVKKVNLSKWCMVAVILLDSDTLLTNRGICKIIAKVIPSKWLSKFKTKKHGHVNIHTSMYPCRQINKMPFTKRKRLHKIFTFEEKSNVLSICIPEVHLSLLIYHCY